MTSDDNPFQRELRRMIETPEGLAAMRKVLDDAEEAGAISPKELAARRAQLAAIEQRLRSTG